MSKRFAGFLSVLVLAGCATEGDSSSGEHRSPALAMPVPLSEGQDGEPEWSESCADVEDGTQTCTYEDGEGTVCVVVGDAEGQLVEQTCTGDWGSYYCVPSDAGYTCELSTPEGSCTDEYDASGQWVGGTCGEYYGEGEYEGGEYEEECEANDDGGYTCFYDDGDTTCTAEVDAAGQLITQLCEGSWGTYDCALQGAEYACVLTVEGESCVETFDRDYNLTSSTCPDYYYEEGGSSSEPSEPCSSYNGLTYCWSVTDAGTCYEWFATGTEPPVEELRCESTYTYVCKDLVDVYGSVCVYSVDGVEVCRDTTNYETYESTYGCQDVAMGPPLE